MAVLQGDNYAKAISPTSDNVASPGTLGGRVRVLQDVVTLAAAQIADTVLLGRQLQAGAKILGIELTNAALGAAVTLDVGDIDDPNRYMAAVDGNTAETKRDLEPAGIQYEITGTDDDIIQITIGGGAATGEIKVNIYYSED